MGRRHSLQVTAKVMFLLCGLSVLIVQAIGIGIMLFVFCDDKKRWRPATRLDRDEARV